MSKMKNDFTNSQSLYKYSFESSPTPTWIEDFSELYDFLQKLKKRKIKNFQKYLDKRPSMVIECTKMIVVVDVNKAAVKLHKAKDKKRLLAFIDDAFTGKSYEIFKKELVAIYNGKKFYEAEAEIKTFDGEIIDVIIRCTLQIRKNKIHTNASAIVTLENITRLKKYQNIINESTAVTFSWVTEPSTRELFVSDNVKNVFGYSADEFLSGKIRYLDIVHPDDRKRAKAEAKYHRFIKKETSYTQNPYRIITKDKKIKWVEDRTSQQKSLSDGFVTYKGIIIDITERYLANERSRKAEQIINTSPAVAFIWKNEKGWPVEFVSENVKNLFGYSAEEFLTGKAPCYDDLIHPEDSKREKKEAANFSKDKSVNYFEPTPYRIITKSGEIKYVEDRTNIIRDDKGNITSFQGLILDITKRINTQNKLRNEEIKFRNLVDKSLVGVYIIQNGKFPYVNPKMAQIYGYKQNEIISLKSVKDLVAPNDRKLVSDNIKKRISGKTNSINYSFKGLKKDGTIFDVEVFGSISSYNDKPAIIGTLLDITDRKKAQQLLEESEEKYRSLTENTKSGIIIVRGERFVYVNPAFEQIAGYKLEDLTNMKFWDIVHSEYKEIMKRRAFARRVGKKVINRYEFKLITKKGKEVWIDYSATKINYMGKPAILGTGFDITKLKETEKKLQESLNRLDKAQHIASMGFLDWDLKSNSIFWSNEICKVFGAKHGENLQTIENTVNLAHPDDRDYIQKNLELASQGKKDYNIDHRMITKDNKTIWVHAQGELIKDKNGKPKYLLGTVVDITKRKLAEKKLIEQYQKNEKILSTTLDGFILADTKGNIVDVNNPYCEMMGYTKEELLTKKIMDVDSFHSPDDFKERIKRINELGHDRFETIHIEKSGEKVNLDVSTSLMEFEGATYVAAFVRDIRERKKYETEILNRERVLRNLATHLQSIREEERKLLARDIHDELGQILTAVKIDLRLLEKTSTENTKEIGAIALLIQDGINATRGLVNQLRPELLQELGLIEAVKDLISKLKMITKVNISFRNEVKSLKLNFNISLPLYRIIQESLNNVIKHSKSKTANVSFKIKGNNLIIKIKDFGIGFDRKEIKTGSFGLLGMRERLIPLNGKLNIESKRGKGTTVTVSVPIEID